MRNDLLFVVVLLVPEENVATPQRDACTVEGQVKEALLNGDTENYNGENGYTTHTITRDQSKGIMVKLNQPYIINCISMLLWDKDNRYRLYVFQDPVGLHEALQQLGTFIGTSCKKCGCGICFTSNKYFPYLLMKEGQGGDVSLFHRESHYQTSH